MATIELVPDQERRAAWLADRQKLITATDAAKVLGLSPFGGPVSVWEDKMGLAPDLDSPAMRRGRRRERLVLDSFADEEGVALEYADSYRVLRSANYPWLGCTLDARRADNRRVVEAKTSRYRTAEWGEEGTDVFPLHYAVQLVIQMHVTDTDLAHLPVEFGGDEFVRYLLVRNLDTERRIIDQLGEWREKHVVAGSLPPVDGTEHYADVLKRLFPSGDRRVIEHATPDQETTAGVLRIRRREHEVLGMEIEELKSTLKLAMKNASELQGSNWHVLWRTSKDSVKVDYESVAYDLRKILTGMTDAEFEAVIGQHTTIKAGNRPFLFKDDQ